MLTGQRATTPILERVIAAAIVTAHVYPLLLLALGLTAVGLLAIGPRKDIPELWVCLPAGLALLGMFAGLALWLCLWFPRLTITRFSFDGAELVVETPGGGRVSQAVDAVLSVSESRRRRRLLGWWLNLARAGVVFLDASTPNAEQLVRRLHTHARHSNAVPNAGVDWRP